jgi:hypothetical protein
VELLVVTAIIVLLLALLAPSLDQAVYQAEILGCAGKLDTVGATLTQYAAEQRRSYPYRDLPPTRPGAGNPQYVSPTELARPVNTFDMRPFISDVLNINRMLQCPMAGQVTLDPTPEGEWVFASYAMWWGWFYQPSENQRLPGLFKLGDRFVWRNEGYSVLAGDWDVYGGSYVHSSHPDDAGRMSLYTSEHEPSAFGVFLTGSTWAITDAANRGLIEMNYVFTDGSVRRYNGVKPYLSGSDRDERMADLPTTWTDVPSERLKRAQVPRQ